MKENGILLKRSGRRAERRDVNKVSIIYVLCQSANKELCSANTLAASAFELARGVSFDGAIVDSDFFTRVSQEQCPTPLAILSFAKFLQQCALMSIVIESTKRLITYQAWRRVTARLKKNVS